MNDKVYLKKEIKSDKLFENHPNLVFGVVIIAFALLVVCSIFWLWFLPFWALAMLWIVAGGLLFWLIIKKNDKSNLSKSDAFIRRDGKLYYIRLGYVLENEIPVSMVEAVVFGPLDAAIAARAEENMIKTRQVQELRKHEETFSNMLTEILNAPLKPSDNNPSVLIPQLPKYVNSFCEMQNPRLEKKTKDWIWISYCTPYTKGQRVTAKYRNAFDLSMLQDELPINI